MRKLLFIITISTFFLLGCSNAAVDNQVKKEENLPEAFAEFEDDTIETQEYSGSLWSANGRSLYNDKKASMVGDIVAIIINENASAQQSASNSRSKGGKIDGKAGTGFLNFVPQMSAEGSTEVDSAGTTRRSGSLTARVSARVYKKDKYGNLYVKGRRNVLINSELQEIEISGYIRPQDISMENTIASENLADAQVKYNGKLVFDGKTKPGMISNFLSGIVGIFF